MSSTQVIDLCNEDNSEDSYLWMLLSPQNNKEQPSEMRRVSPEQGYPEQGSEPLPDKDYHIEVIEDNPEFYPDFHIDSEVGPIEIHSSTHNNPCYRVSHSR